MMIMIFLGGYEGWGLVGSRVVVQMMTSMGKRKYK